jgi:hypothetical protein
MGADKILLEGDRNSNKMNPLDRTPKITRSTLLPFVCQNQLATKVLLVLGTNTTSSLDSYTNTTAETEDHVWFEDRWMVRTMCGSRTGGWSLPCVMSD